METLTNSSLQHYYNEIDPDDMPDLEIKCGVGTIYPAHRALLACHSPFLREIFLTDPINQEQEIVLHLPDFSPEDVEALIGFLYGKVPEISSGEEIFKSLSMDRPIVELEVEVSSNPLDANVEANPGELFGHFNGSYMEATDIETAEILIDTSNNNFMVDEGEESKSGQRLLCPICDSVVFAGGSLDAHLKTEHPVCGVCQVQFLRPQDLAAHWPVHPQCGVCGESVLDWAALDEHEEREHGVIRDALNITATIDLSEAVSEDLGVLGQPMPIDGRKFSELFQEINPDLCIENVECGPNDVNSNLLSSRYVCNFCSMVFTSIDDLHHHTAEDHRDLLGALDHSQGHQSPVNETSGIENSDVNCPLRCGICRAGFEDFRILASHVSQHLSLGKLESGLPFPCKFCPPGNFNFVEIDDLLKHSKVYHYREEDLSASCPECSRTFKNPRALKMHIGMHSSIKPFHCGGCSGQYSTLNNLKMHFRNYCGANRTPWNRRPAKLERPSLNYDSNSKLEGQEGIEDDVEKKVDLSASEKGSRRFTCSECGVVFKSRDLIQLHVSKCPAVKSKLLLHEAQVHLQGVTEKKSINLPNDSNKDSQQIRGSHRFKTGCVDLSAPLEASQDDVRSSEEDSPQMPQTSTDTYTQVRTGKRGRPKKMTLEFSDSKSCKSPFRSHKCTPKLKPQEETKSENVSSLIDDDYVPSAQERRTPPRISKKSPSTPDSKTVKTEVQFDDYDWTSQEQIKFPISRAGSETTRSGRLIKRKRIFEPEPEIKKRLRRSTLAKAQSADREDSRCGPAGVSTACQVCSEDQGSHEELFRHAVTHLESSVGKTLPVYEDGDTGWCPHCCEPVVVQFSEEHVLDKHPEMVIPGAGPSRVMLPELKDELSPHLSDEETRSVIKDPC